ncbi:MAG: hypothetical protein C0602_03965 [Denitrovibrio sp.]|nr:MAG: hypothetical protein C0602_03965 [Denitrovibrio sp.]
MNKDRILFVILPQSLMLPTLGPAYLISYLRQYHIAADVFDCNLYKENFISELKKVVDTGYRLISMGFAMDQLFDAVSLTALIKNQSPQCTVIIGGAGPSSAPEYCLKKTGADVLFSGEAELALTKYAQGFLHGPHNPESIPGIYIRQGEDIIFTGREEIIHDLDTIPFPDLDSYINDYVKLEHQRFSYPAGTQWAPILTSRGCTHKCNFCFHTGKFRMRSITNVIEELLLLNDIKEIGYVQFYDDLFTHSKERVLEFCEAYHKNNFTFRHYVKGRAEIFDKEIVDALRDSGCDAIAIGVESYNEKTLDFIGKKVTKEQLKNACDVVKDGGVNLTLTYIFGEPTDTKESLDQTVDFVKDYIDGYENIPRTPFDLIPYPGTPIYRWGVKNGFIRDEDDFMEKLRLASKTYKPVFNFTDIPQSEFEALFASTKIKIMKYWIPKRLQYLNKLEKANTASHERLSEWRKSLNNYLSQYNKSRTVCFDSSSGESLIDSLFSKFSTFIKDEHIEKLSIFGLGPVGSVVLGLASAAGIKITRLYDSKAKTVLDCKSQKFTPDNHDGTPVMICADDHDAASTISMQMLENEIDYYIVK